MANLSTDDVMREFGIPPRTLQYWAETGFVAPSERTPGGHARYTEGDIKTLRVVKILMSEGFSIQQMRNLLPVITCVLERLAA